MKKLYTYTASIILGFVTATASVNAEAPRDGFAAPDKERPDRPERPRLELPEELEEALNEVKDARSVLHAAVKQIVEEAKANGATKEEIKALVAEYKEAHADEIAAVKEAAAAVREQLKEYREEHAGDRPELPEEVQAVLDTFRTGVAELKEERSEFIENLDPELSEEEKKAAIKEFVGGQREEFKALRDAKKEALKELRDNRPDGDAREDDEG